MRLQICDFTGIFYARQLWYIQLADYIFMEKIRRKCALSEGAAQSDSWLILRVWEVLLTSQNAFCVYKCTACHFVNLQNWVFAHSRKPVIWIGVISATKSLIMLWTHEKDYQYSWTFSCVFCWGVIVIYLSFAIAPRKSIVWMYLGIVFGERILISKVLQSSIWWFSENSETIGLCQKLGLT